MGSICRNDINCGMWDSAGSLGGTQPTFMQDEDFCSTLNRNTTSPNARDLTQGSVSLSARGEARLILVLTHRAMGTAARHVTPGQFLRVNLGWSLRLRVHCCVPKLSPSELSPGCWSAESNPTSHLPSFSEKPGPPILYTET